MIRFVAFPRFWLSPVLAAVLLSGAGPARGTETAAAGDLAVAYQLVPESGFARFVKNWGGDGNGIFCTVVATMPDYESVFAPARVMRDERPYAPPPAFFEHSRLLVVARVVDGATGGDPASSPFQIGKVVVAGDALEMHYRFTKPEEKPGFQSKACLTVRIPKDGPQEVRFIENGKPVGKWKASGK